MRKNFLPLVMLRGRNRKKAFTLLELILAVAIYSVIIVVLVSGFNLSIKVYRRIRDSEVFKIGDFLDKFSSDFRSSYVFTKNTPLKFIASGNSLKFIRISSLNDNFHKKATCGLKTVEYFLSVDKGDYRSLYRREEPFFISSRKKLARKEKLLSSLSSLKFSYFNGETWKSTWDSPYQLPQAVRITIKLKRGKAVEVLSTVIDRI